MVKKKERERERHRQTERDREDRDKMISNKKRLLILFLAPICFKSFALVYFYILYTNLHIDTNLGSILVKHAPQTFPILSEVLYLYCSSNNGISISRHENYY